MLAKDWFEVVMVLFKASLGVLAMAATPVDSTVGPAVVANPRLRFL